MKEYKSLLLYNYVGNPALNEIIGDTDTFFNNLLEKQKTAGYNPTEITSNVISVVSNRYFVECMKHRKTSYTLDPRFTPIIAGDGMNITDDAREMMRSMSKSVKKEFSDALEKGYHPDDIIMQLISTVMYESACHHIKTRIKTKNDSKS